MKTAFGEDVNVEELKLGRKPHQHSFYKSITIVVGGALLLSLQLITREAAGGNQIAKSPAYNSSAHRDASRYIEGKGQRQAQLYNLKQQHGEVNAHAGMTGRRLLQDEDDCEWRDDGKECPPYCRNGGFGQPYDPICACDPTVDDLCRCPVVDELVYDEWPCGWDIACQDITLFNTTEDKCNFTRTSSYCAILEGFINYNEVIYCDFGNNIPLIMCILTVYWIFLFVSLAVCADDFFCTALVVIVKTLDLSPGVAGVTFLAFGNGAPDLFSAIAAFLAMKAGDAGLAIGGLFGAGIFVTTIIVGTVAIVKPFKVPERPFLRDDIFYLVGAYYMFFIIWRERIYLIDAIGFVLIYIVYVVVVILSGNINKRMQSSVPLGTGKGALHVASATADEGTDMIGFQVSNFKPSASTYSLSTIENEFAKANGTATYDNVAFEGDDGQKLSEEEKKKKEDLRALGRKISEEIDAERNQVDFQQGTLSGDADNASNASLEFEKIHPIKLFFMGINPINVEEWPTMPWYLRCYEIFKAPIMFLFKVTVPTVIYDIEPTHNWNRYLQTFQCLIGPMWCAVLIGNAEMTVFGSVPLLVILLGVGACIAIPVFLLTENYKRPKWHEAFGYMAFVIAMIWIYMIATEIVNLLTAFGVVFQLSNGILGLTLLAWGNSVGDFVADMVMAKQGFPRMAFSACFGAPIFHLCLGTGIPFLARMGADGVTDMKLNMDTMLMMANIAVMFSMIFSLFTLLFTKFKANTFYGICLVVFYAVFVLVTILVETDVIPRELASHVDI